MAYFLLSFQYHSKVVKLLDKYNCFLSKSKQKHVEQIHQGCPKSQSFYAPMNNLGQLVTVTHNPDTNVTVTNVGSPQTPASVGTKTQTLSTSDSSRVSFTIFSWL